MGFGGDQGLLLPFALVATVLLALYHYSQPRYDPKEPPVIPSTIPYVGHIIGLLRHGTKYFEDLG